MNHNMMTSVFESTKGLLRSQLHMIRRAQYIQNSTYSSFRLGVFWIILDGTIFRRLLRKSLQIKHLCFNIPAWVPPGQTLSIICVLHDTYDQRKIPNLPGEIPPDPLPNNLSLIYFALPCQFHYRSLSESPHTKILPRCFGI